MNETEEIRKLRKLLADANRGAEINAHINNSLTKKLQERTAERDEAREQLVRSNHFLHQAEENLESIYRERDEAREKYDILATEHMLEVNKLCNERDEAREDAHQLTQKRNELLAYLDAAHYATCNAELRRERDEARREVDRYREEKDLSPMSWDT
ncbi:MAG: hypothetical protein KGR46_12020 [Verrucomicrobia bacterium]|nr:hypothetical protein [Verrucomicrobiota bacterium]